MKNMTSPNKVIIKAARDWIIENNLTPFILIDVHYPDVEAPIEHSENGVMVLDISDSSLLEQFNIDNFHVKIKCSFGNKPFNLKIPLGSVKLIFAKENNVGFSLPLNISVSPTKESINLIPINLLKV